MQKQPNKNADLGRGPTTISRWNGIVTVSPARSVLPTSERKCMSGFKIHMVNRPRNFYKLANSPGLDEKYWADGTWTIESEATTFTTFICVTRTVEALERKPKYKGNIQIKPL